MSFWFGSWVGLLGDGLRLSMLLSMGLSIWCFKGQHPDTMETASDNMKLHETLQLE